MIRKDSNGYDALIIEVNTMDKELESDSLQVRLCKSMLVDTYIVMRVEIRSTWLAWTCHVHELDCTTCLVWVRLLVDFKESLIPQLFNTSHKFKHKVWGIKSQ